MVFRTTSGKYFERVGVQVVTPYHAGAWGDWDPAAKTGHDDTEALQKAINCAQVVPRFLEDSSGNATTTLSGEMGKFRGGTHPLVMFFISLLQSKCNLY